MTDPNPLTASDTRRDDSAWAHTVNYEKEDRAIHPVQEILLNGSVDMVFFRSATPCLVVAGIDQEAIRSVHTDIRGDALIINREGSSITVAGGTINVSGNGTVVINGVRIDVGASQTSAGRVVVGVALPYAPDIKLKGSGTATLYDLSQDVLNVRVQGSGDVIAFGAVEHLDARVQGSGDVEAGDLSAFAARLSVTGSGDIDACVTSSVKARVTGSGDIAVYGNPPTRDHSVTGSGHVKFKNR